MMLVFMFLIMVVIGIVGGSFYFAWDDAFDAMPTNTNA
jgi:hypothetical protein